MHRFWRIILSCLVAFLFFFQPTSVAGGETIKSNLDVLNELATEVARELISQFEVRISKSQGILLAPHVKDETYDFLTNVFTRELASRNFKTYAPTASISVDVSGSELERDDGQPVKLEFQALEFNLTYPKVFRSYLIGGKKIKRRADIKVFAKLLDISDQTVVWAGDASRDYEDQFPYGARAGVEKGLFAFTKPQVKSIHWGRIIEPVVVSGIIVGLVYLFFSNQSDS